MRVDIIDNSKELAALRADWDAVYEADPEAQFFLSWTWMSRWLPAIGTPWFVLAARPDDRSPYAAFFPLWLETKEQASGGFHNNILMGGNYVADYTGYLCMPGQEEQAVSALAGRIKQLNWTRFRLEDLCLSDRRIAVLLEAFSKREFDAVKLNRVEHGIDHGICPAAHLPADWDEYLETRLSANTRQKIRRLLRRIETSGEFRITHAEKDTVERDLDILLRFWAERWGPQKGERLKDILQNTRLMLRHSFDVGALFLPVLWQGERPVCALATLIDERKRSFLFYMAGRDESFDGLPTGLALHAHSIRHAICYGFTTYDFLRGNEPYKQSFGVEERLIHSYVLTTKDKKNLGGKLHRRSLPYALRRSMEHHRAGRYAAAEAGYRQVLEVEPRTVDALYGLGQITAKRGEHAAAVALFKTLVAAAPDTQKAWFRLGRSLRVGGEFREAARAYCEGLERPPAPAGAYYDLGHLLLQLGQPDLAVAAFEAARGLQPGLADLEASLGRARRARAALSPEDLARRAADHAELRDRVGRVGAIAAVRERELRTARPLVVAAREHGGAGSP
jgi:CelD/BcsL family acetyltransferase involved in cellulose biosynthesis/thioredoxin-like negative regulator of GroEL